MNKFTTDSGNSYCYSDKHGDFLLLPSFSSDSITSEGLHSDNTDNYYRQKLNFWKENGVFEIDSQNIETEYNTKYIEMNLANLRQLLIEVTDSCNLSCKYCGYGEFYGNYDTRTNKKLKFEEIKVLIDYLCELWISPQNLSFDNIVYISFYGGEPLLNFKLIKEVIDYLETLHLSNMNFEYSMTTNGMLLDKYMDFIAEKKIHMLVSLDGNKVNNSYRLSRTGKESFDKVVSNLEKLQETYPVYFDEEVQFNAVLHDRNSVIDISNYIYKKFGKNPGISELNTGGIRADRKKDFEKMFVSRADSFYQYINCEEKKVELEKVDPDMLAFSTFYNSFVKNSYRTYADLFYSIENRFYLPTGTCPPFYKKIFVTVNGKLFPCERIGQQTPLGYLKDGKVELNGAEIQQIYKRLYNRFIKQCKTCYAWKNCQVCAYFIEEKDGKTICPFYHSKRSISSYFSSVFSRLEEQPKFLQEQVLDELTTD